MLLATIVAMRTRAQLATPARRQQLCLHATLALALQVHYCWHQCHATPLVGPSGGVAKGTGRLMASRAGGAGRQEASVAAARRRAQAGRAIKECYPLFQSMFIGAVRLSITRTCPSISDGQTFIA